MSQAVYTLFIEDRVGRGVSCTERAVTIRGTNGNCYESLYNPNKGTGSSGSTGPFDTSFSIIHPMREVAKELVRSNNPAKYEGGLKYGGDVNSTQQTLFENILAQEIEKYQKVSTFEVPDVRQKIRPYRALPPPGAEHEIGMTAGEILATRDR